MSEMLSHKPRDVLSHEFAVMVVPRVSVDDMPEPYLSGSTTLSAFKSLPPELVESWKHSIGHLKYKETLESELFLIATINSERPSKDAECVSAEDRVCELYWSLFLSDFVTETHSPIIMRGKPTEEGKPRIWSFGDLPISYASGCLVPQPITAEQLHAAFKLATCLSSFSRLDRFSRIRRALHAFWNGIKAGSSEERIHHFCRSVEAFILPEKGRTERRYESRGELFVGAKGAGRLRQIYQVRSDYIHMNHPLTTLRENRPDLSELQLWTEIESMTVQIEAVARHCLKSIVRDPILRDRFDSDENLSTFWKLWHQNGNRPCPERKQCLDLWPDPIDLEKLLDLHFDEERSMEHHTQE